MVEVQAVDQLVFRKLTDADFFNINKPSGIEEKGGGQSYIDLPISAVSLSNWGEFFKGVGKENGYSGPIWNFLVRSLGANQPPQKVTIAQRRQASVSIRSQKVLSSANNRVYAWRPEMTGFPKPANPKVRSHIYDLHIYIARLDNGEFWAGWFQASKPEPNWPINNTLNRMFNEDQGYLKFDGDVLFDPTDAVWPFRIKPKAPTSVEPTILSVTPGEEDPEEKSFFDADEAAAQDAPPEVKEAIRRVRVRNTKAVRKLKALYDNRCQVTGEKFTFVKRDGTFYSEAHHLIPLGKGGADSVYNIVIISPLIHRMFHYAKNIEGLDLKNIKDNKLPIRINGVEYVITWHPAHGSIVQAYA
jgi:5-methylcytosine-specific restriction enzyme A